MFTRATLRQFLLIVGSSTVCFVSGAPSEISRDTQEIVLSVQAGSPIRIELEERTPIREGQPVRGKLAHPLHVYDREVVPAGATVLGRVRSVLGASGKERAKTYTRGQLRIKKQALVEFSTLVLDDGTQLPLKTSVTMGTPSVIRLTAGAGENHASQKNNSGIVASARSKIKSTATNNEVVRALRSKDAGKASAGTPKKARRIGGGRWRWVQNVFLPYWPFGQQNLRPGTQFTAVLEEPLDFGRADLEVDNLQRLASLPPPDSIVQARLLQAISSETAEVGSPVKAVITKPLFSPEGDLLLPEGVTLAGEVTQVKPARRFGRDGRLRFRFTKIEMPSGLTQIVSGSLAAVEVDSRSRMDLDTEGGARVAPSAKRFIAPAVSVAVQMTAVPDGDDGAPPTTTVQGSAPGWSGFGILGSAAALSAPAAAGPIGIWGAANSIYFNLVRKADELEFPKNTLLEIRFGRASEEVEALPPDLGETSAPDAREPAEPRALRTR